MIKKSFLAIALLLMALAFSSCAYAALEDTKSISINLVNQDPDPAVAGDIVELRLAIENLGSVAAENIVIELDPVYPFVMLPGEDNIQKIGTILYQGEANVKIIKYRLKIDRDANAGQYELKILEYEDGKKDEWLIIKTVNIDIKNRANAEVIYIDKVQLLPGKITPMTFTINNVGSAPLRYLTFYWENKDDVILPVGSDDTKYIKYIEVNESAELVYNVIASANAEPDLYKLKLSLTYDDPISGEEKEIVTNAGVYVGGETDFDVTFSGSSKGDTSFSVANIGNVPANSVTISISNQRGWRVSGIDSVIIGNLNKGDYTIASFSLQQTGITTQETSDENSQITDRTKPSSIPQIPLNIDISYTDTMGNRHTVIKEISIDSSAMAPEDGEITFGSKRGSMETPADNTSSTTTMVGIGILAIIIFIIVQKVYQKKNLGKTKKKK